MSFFGLFGSKKPTLKLIPKTMVELEFENSESEYENYFIEVVNVAKKKVTLNAPGTDMRPIRLVPGQPVTVSTFDEDKNTFFSYSASVLDSREREFDVNPPKDVDSEEIPPRDENFRVEVPIQVEFRAMSTVHSQVATTHAITTNGLFLLTNLPIPPGTPLTLELEIPNAPDIKANGHAVNSERDGGGRKHITEVEYDDIPEDDKRSILRYAIYYEQRQKRKQKRESEGL
ncbi:MAG: PilZ domain-containing protein [Vulcanimicrobiota bacterium]